VVGHVALVTCQRARGLDTDEPLLLAALDAADVDVEVLDWDRPADWSVYDLAVIRSTWDYAGRHEEFLAWAATTAKATRLHNPVAMLTWNTDKGYLTQLAQSGLPVIDTTFFAPGTNWQVTELTGPIVVKPSVSAGGQDAARYGVGELNGAREHVETVAARVPSPAERALGDATMEWLSGSSMGSPLYARIDLLPDAKGLPRILEVELTEPSLFLETDDRAADRMAGAIRGLLDR